MKLKYITILGSNLKDFKMFGKKIYTIKITRKEYGLFYENELTIVYKEKWYVLILTKISLVLKIIKSIVSKK